MSNKSALTFTSLLSVVFLTLHVTSDFIHNTGELSLQGVLIVSTTLSLVLFGTLALSEKKLGYGLMMFGALAAVGMPIIHLMSDRGVERSATRPDGYFFVFVLLVLGVTGLFTFMLCIRGLLSRRA